MEARLLLTKDWLDLRKRMWRTWLKEKSEVILWCFSVSEEECQKWKGRNEEGSSLAEWLAVALKMCQVWGHMAIPSKEFNMLAWREIWTRVEAGAKAVRTARRGPEWNSAQTQHYRQEDVRHSESTMSPDKVCQNLKEGVICVNSIKHLQRLHVRSLKSRLDFRGVE